MQPNSTCARRCRAPHISIHERQYSLQRIAEFYFNVEITIPESLQPIADYYFQDKLHDRNVSQALLSFTDACAAVVLPAWQSMSATARIVCTCALPTAYCLLPTAYCLLPTTYYLLPTTYYLLPTPYSLLPTPYCLLPTPYSLLPTQNSLLPSTYYLLPTTFYLLPTAYYLLPTTYYLLPTTYCLLPTAYYLLPTYLLPTTYYLLPTTYYLLPTTYYYYYYYYYYCYGVVGAFFGRSNPHDMSQVGRKRGVSNAKVMLESLLGMQLRGSLPPSPRPRGSCFPSEIRGGSGRTQTPRCLEFYLVNWACCGPGHPWSHRLLAARPPRREDRCRADCCPPPLRFRCAFSSAPAKRVLSPTGT